MKKYEQDCAPFKELFEKPEVQQCKGAQLLDYLKEHFNVRAVHPTCVLTIQLQPESINTLFDYAKFQYECGNYKLACEYLHNYRVLVSALPRLRSLAVC
jgi:translation initiation factor 3 subunit E